MGGAREPPDERAARARRGRGRLGRGEPTVSTPDKPDPARGWLHVETLLALDETERVEKLSDADFDKEMRAKGRDPARVPTPRTSWPKRRSAPRKREGSSANPTTPVAALRARRLRP